MVWQAHQLATVPPRSGPIAGGGDEHFSAPPADRLFRPCEPCLTSAAGFIGSTLVDRLVDEGHQVAGIEDYSEPGTCVGAITASTHADSRWYSRYSGSRADHNCRGRQPHVIFHLSAQVDICTSVSDPQFDARSNVLGTMNLWRGGGDRCSRQRDGHWRAVRGIPGRCRP